MTTQLALDFSPLPDPAFPVCPFCGEEQLLDFLHGNLLDWIPCCLEAREAVETEGWEVVFGAPLEGAMSALIGADVREVIVDSSIGDSLVRFALELGDRNGEAGWQREVFEEIDLHHRHHPRPVGWKFGVEVWNGTLKVGVAVETENGQMLDLEEIWLAGAAEERARMLAWLDAEIEAARQLNRQDPIATRTALERVKARLLG